MAEDYRSHRRRGPNIMAVMQAGRVALVAAVMLFTAGCGQLFENGPQAAYMRYRNALYRGNGRAYARCFAEPAPVEQFIKTSQTAQRRWQQLQDELRRKFPQNGEQLSEQLEKFARPDHNRSRFSWQQMQLSARPPKEITIVSADLLSRWTRVNSNIGESVQMKLADGHWQIIPTQNQLVRFRRMQLKDELMLFWADTMLRRVQEGHISETDASTALTEGLGRLGRMLQELSTASNLRIGMLQVRFKQEILTGPRRSFRRGG